VDAVVVERGPVPLVDLLGLRLVEERVRVRVVHGGHSLGRLGSGLDRGFICQLVCGLGVGLGSGLGGWLGGWLFGGFVEVLDGWLDGWLDGGLGGWCTQWLVSGDRGVGRWPCRCRDWCTDCFGCSSRGCGVCSGLDSSGRS